MESEQEEQILGLLDGYSVTEIRPNYYKVLVYGRSISYAILKNTEKAGYRIITIDAEIISQTVDDEIESYIDLYVNILKVSS